MPWADPEKNAEAVRRWRAAHPGYAGRYARSCSLTVSRYACLDEDLAQQVELHRISRRREDDPKAYRLRERRWIQATAYWTSDDASGTHRRRVESDDP